LESITDTVILANLMGGRKAAQQREKAAQTENAQGWALIRGEDGLVKVPMTSEIKAAIGRFDSKQGSTRRSKKGRTWIMPNGYSRYINPCYHSGIEVVSYKITQ
jgi:hypothetical protein